MEGRIAGRSIRGVLTKAIKDRHSYLGHFFDGIDGTVWKIRCRSHKLESGFIEQQHIETSVPTMHVFFVMA